MIQRFSALYSCISELPALIAKIILVEEFAQKSVKMSYLTLPFLQRRCMRCHIQVVLSAVMVTPVGRLWENPVV